jgi:hypothetical protein
VVTVCCECEALQKNHRKNKKQNKKYKTPKYLSCHLFSVFYLLLLLYCSVSPCSFPALCYHYLACVVVFVAAAVVVAVAVGIVVVISIIISVLMFILLLFFYGYHLSIVII